jgi:hypothetical protein
VDSQILEMEGGSIELESVDDAGYEDYLAWIEEQLCVYMS